MRTSLAALCLVCLAAVATACSRDPSPSDEESPTPPEAADVLPVGETGAQAVALAGAVGEADTPSDEGLPAPDEIPAFLGGAQMPPDPPLVVELDDCHLDGWAEEWAESEREPTLQELMARVTVGGHEPDEEGLADIALSPPEVPDQGFVGDEGSGAPLPSLRAAGDSRTGGPPTAPTTGASRKETWAKSSNPSLQALMASVTLEDDSVTESWSYLGGDVSPDPSDAPGDAQRHIRTESAPEGSTPAPGPGPARQAVPPSESASADASADASPDASPCEPLRMALAQHRDYLLRVGAERDSFGYVESNADSSALRLLQGLRRCSSNPEDADCKRPPIEVDISDLEVPSHQIIRDPSDLNAEGRSPDDIAHDRVSLDLLHKLRQCERSQIAQPLLQR